MITWDAVGNKMNNAKQYNINGKYKYFTDGFRDILATADVNDDLLEDSLII